MAIGELVGLQCVCVCLKRIWNSKIIIIIKKTTIQQAAVIIWMNKLKNCRHTHTHKQAWKSKLYFLRRKLQVREGRKILI